MRAVSYCDGRGNAGTGACATVIYLYDLHEGTGASVHEFSRRLGSVTNNVAEYEAVLLTIEKAIELDVTSLLIQSDSQVTVNQLLGLYEAKNSSLKKLRDKAWNLARTFEKVEITWVPREKTKRPDQLCRLIDREPSPRPNPIGRSLSFRTRYSGRKRPY